MADAAEHETDNCKDAIPRVKLIQKFETGLKIKQVVFLESALSYLLFTETGEVYLIENGPQNVIKKLEGRCSPNQLHAIYASSRHSLVLQNGDKLLVRRDQNGVFLLQKAFVENVIESGNAFIEVPVQEIVEWQKFFATDISRTGMTESPELQKLEEIMKATMQEYYSKRSKSLTAILNIPKVHEFVSNLETCAYKVLKHKCNVYPVFPLVFWLIERIRWTLDREQPYHLGNKNNKGRTIDVSLMNIEAARLLSFYKWPHMNYRYALPYRMAETGFFFQPNINGDDRVVCFSCNISLVLWEPNDEPVSEHERHHTNHCRFNEDTCNDNVPLDVTTSCQPFALIPFDNESVIIASAMNASAEFFAVADASNNSVVRLFHLDSCPLQPFILQFNFLRDLRSTFVTMDFGEYNAESSNQMSKITALCVAGRERLMNIDGDADTVAELFIGASIDGKAFKALTTSSKPFVFVYKVSRHLKEKAEKPQPPKPLPPAPPLSITDMFSDGEPSSSSLLHDPDDDVIDVDFWSPDDMMDDNFDPVAFKSKMQKKSRALNEENNPAAEIDYNPFKLKYSYLGHAELQFESGEDWVINNITTCDVTDGLIAVSAYSKTQNKSAVAHFARRSDYHRIADGEIKYQYFDSEIKKLVILPVDHFASFRVSNFADFEPFGPNIVLGNTLVLNKLQELFLFDCVSGKSIKIESNVVDFIVDDKQNLMVASEEGEMKNIHVAASLTAMQSERIDEVALSMISALNYSKKSILKEIGENFPSHPSFKQVMELLQRLQINKPLTSDVLEAVSFLIKSRPVRSIATQTRVMTHKTAIAALESYLQHSLGFQIISPPHFTESVRSITQKATSTIDTSNHSQKTCKENAVKDDQPIPTRAWRFLPEREKIKPAYVFKMAFIPGMPLSHINFKFNFTSNSNGSPDALFTIYRSKENFNEGYMNGMESSSLIPYCDFPSLLDNECEKMLGPYRIDSCVNADNTYSLIQISSTVILEALSAARLKEDWFTKPVFLYLLIEVSKRPSLAQQINTRTQLVAQANKTRSRSDKARVSRTSGGYKKKFHSRKGFIAKNTKTSAAKNVATSSACRLAIIKRKDASSSKRPSESPVPPNEPKEGFMYIEEFSVTLYRCQKQPNGHEQLQRIILQKDSQIHKKLFEIALREDLTTVGVNTVASIQKTQLQALDLLIWITQGWRLSSKYLPSVLELLEAIVCNYEKLFVHGFSTASNHIAQKWNTLIGQLLKIVNNQESVDCEALYTQLINLMKKSLLNDLGKIEKPGSLHWFLASVFTVIYESTYLLIDGTHITAANQLAETCIEVLQKIGDIFQKKWNASMHQTLSTKYGLSGLIFELNLFDFPQQLLGYRTVNESFIENEKTNISSIFKPPQNHMINPITGYNPAALGGPLAYLSHINPPKPYREPPQKPIPSDGEPSISGKLFPYSEHETLSLMEMLNLNIGYGDDSAFKQPWMVSLITEGDWFDIEDKIPERSRIHNDLLSRFSWSRFAVGSELLSGLMEYEPLSFECIGPADHIQAYNCDTRSYSSVSLNDTILSNSTTKAPEVQRVIASIKNMDFNKTANYQLSNEIFSIFKPPCDFVLSVERVTANSKRQVVLDFGGPTLLKSFIIPPSEYVQIVYVDGWWSSEDVDSIRIAQSKTIKNKALIISNMQPGILIRKLKLTFIMKGTTGKARVPVGRYFGSKWLSEYDVSTASVPYSAATGDPITVTDVCIEAPLAKNLAHMLQYFCEEVRCRYNIAAAELKKLIEEGYSAIQVKDAYVLCFNLRLQWNISYNVMEKLQSINKTFLPKENVSQKDLCQLDMEHLKSLCSSLLNFSNELTNILDLRDSAREILVQATSQTSRESDEHSLTPISHIQPTQIMTLETAIAFFDFYCTHNVPSIKTLGCAQLFKNGCFTSWWGNLFPELLSKYFFGLDNNSIDNETFLVLSILCSHSVKHSHLQQSVMEKLFNFIINICKELMHPEVEERNLKNNSSLLSWTLQLLSTSFDVVACNKRKTDRWSFLSGLFGQSSNYTPSIPTTTESSSSRILSSFDQMSTRDKIFSRWKEIFNYDDFLTELEKPQYISRRLDILADRLQYLHALIREEFDGIPAIPPTKRESFSLPISVETVPNKAATPPLPDTASTRLLVVPLHNLQSRVRVRQYSARLKISETLCLSVVQNLLELLLHEKSGRVFPYTSQLLAVKVISKICLHGSVSSIPLTCALGEKLHDFVFKMLKASKEYEWMRYALLMLLVDLTDAEIRSFGRNVSQRQMRTVVEEEIGVEAKRHKPCMDTEVEMSEENSVNNEVLSDQAMEDLTLPEADALSDIIGPEGSTTAIIAGVNDSPWAFVTPSTEFISFSNFDRISFENVDEHILRAAVAVLIGMEDINPVFLKPIPSKNISVETRFSTLLQWLFRLTRYYHDRGEPLTNIFRFFDEAFTAEEEHYLKCNTSECYLTTYPLAVFENTRMGPFEESEKSEKSFSAQAFISFCDNFLTDERKAAALNEKSENVLRDALELRFLQATIEAKYHLRLCGMRHLCREMQIGDVELQKAINGHMMRIRYKLPELTSMALDANGDKMISADPDALRTFDAFAANAVQSKMNLKNMLKTDKTCLEKVLNVYSKILFINVTWPNFEDFSRLTKHVFSEQTLVEMSLVGEETPAEFSSIGQSSAEPIQPLDTAELKCALENLTNDIQMSARIKQLNQAVHLQFSADLAVAGDNMMVQPAEIAINFLMDMQFGFQPFFEASYREQVRGTLARNCVYNFVPHCISTRKSGEESKESSTGLGQSVRAVVNVVNAFLTVLEPETSPETLLNVLTFYLEFTGYVHCITGACNSTKTIVLEKGAFEPPPLSYDALFKLLHFVTVNANINEELWQNVLTSFTRNIRKDISNPLLSSTSTSFNLRQFMQKFFSDSLHAYGIGTSFGPTSLEHMGTLLSKLLASDSANGKYLEQYIDSLSSLFVEPSSSSFGALPIETLSAIIDIVGQNLKIVVKDNVCDVQKVSLLLCRVVQMIRVAFPRFDGYLRNCSTPGKPPGASNTQLSQANMCFTSISPPSSSNISPAVESVPLSNAIKLPELSFQNSKSASPETSSSFRRTQKHYPAKLWQVSNAASTADPFDYEGFESGFDSMRAYTNDQSFDKPNVDRTEMLFVLFIKFINTCSQLGPVWTIAVQRYPQTITMLIDLLNECESAVDPVTEVNLDFWNPQTLADHLLYILLAVSNGVGPEGENARRFMQVSLQTIFKEKMGNNEATKISDPLIFALMKLNYQLQRKELFVQLDGHQHIAEQLKKCLTHVNNRWPAGTDMFTIGQQLCSVANEVVGIQQQIFDVQNLPAKLINGSKVYNFSPASRINGHSINTSSLANILMDPIPHRRSRHAAYAYTFPASELWTSVTISLPCQIMLYEIQIKCHQYSLNTPSAVQVELSSDVLPARHWALFGGNFVTAGLISTVIDTSRHQLPVGAVRLHLRRPNGYTGTINLSQIIIYGIVTSPKMRAQAQHEKSLVNWLTLYDKFQSVQPSLWQYASILPQKLMQLFIQCSNDHKIYPLLRQVISNIDFRTKSNEATIIELILKHVFSGGRLSDGISPVISAEMLYSFCTESESITPQRAAIRQQQLLLGAEHLLTLINDKSIFDDVTFSIILWSSSCIIWNNLGNESIRYQTVASCLEVGNRIRQPLWQIAISTSNDHKLIKSSAAWLLCSLFRADPNLARSSTEELFKQDKVEFSKEELFALSKIYQSESAAMDLFNSGILMKFVQESIKLASEGVKNVTALEMKKLSTLINYIEFLAELSVIDAVCVFLQQPDCHLLFKMLLSSNVYCFPVKTIKETLNIFANLNKATILLCQRCIAYSNVHRKLISYILTELLADEKTRFCGRIDGTLLQLILRLVLEDECITVRIKGIQGPNYANESFSSRIMHPVFGCVSTDRIFSASLFTFLRDMVPLRQSELSKLKVTLAGMYDEMNTFDNFQSFLSSHKKKLEPEIQESSELSDGVVCEELGQKQLVARIFCEQISSCNSLNLKRNLNDLLWRTSVNENCCYKIDCNGKISKSIASDLKTFGYLTLLMEVRVTNRTEGASVADVKSEYFLDDLTMLQHFALAGGFSKLSSHFPMADIYSSVLETYEGLCKKQRELTTKSSQGPTAENAAPPKAPKQQINQGGFASQFQQQFGQVLTASSNLQAMIAGTPVSLSVLEPSSIVGYQNGAEASAIAAVMSSSLPVTSSTGLADNSFQAFGNAMNFLMNNTNNPTSGPVFIGSSGTVPPSILKTPALSALNSRQNLSGEREVPAYTIFALSMLLKLDYYAITLVTCDRFQAKRVLRAAMGLTTNEREMSSIMSSFRPILPKSSATSTSIIVNQLPERKMGCTHINTPGYLTSSRRGGNELEKSKRETENLTIYPFFVLERFWLLSGPQQCGKEISSKIRFAADNQGILDVILLCTSRFSNTPPRWQVSFPPSSDAQAIDQIFQLSDQIDTLRDTLASSPAAPSAKQQLQGMQSLSSALMPPHEALMMGGTSQQHVGQQDYFPKGTGFGSGNTQAQWNVNEHVRRRKLCEEAVTCMINVISGYLNPASSVKNGDNNFAEDIGLKIALLPYDKAANFHDEPLSLENQIPFTFSTLSKIYNSCLMPVIHSYLTNDSVFDISKHVSVYEACIWFVITVAALKPVEATEDELKLLVEFPKSKDIFASMLIEEYRGNSVFNQMKKMHEMIKVYLSTIDKERKPEDKNQDNEKTEDSQEEENLEALAVLLQKALIILEHRLNPLLAAESEAMEVDKETRDIGSITFEEIYINAMKSIQYESIPFFKSDDNKVMEIPHHYSSTFLANTSMGNQKRWRRLAQETITLSSSLPLTASSSVFMKACEERLDVFKLMITGPPGTPYSNGCFEFDAYMPSDYPNVPVQISLQTTGGNSVRFNPNLYNDGKVCLSILNTWHGRPEERWNAETSSFLQVIVSIQSLILVNEPYFNEPGYERSRNTPAGQQASRDYDANIRNQTVRWAMLEQIRHPPKGFEEIVRRHFWIKRDEICEQVEEWISEMQKLCDTSNDPSIRVTKTSLSGLIKNFEDLKAEFAKMVAPEGLQKLASKYFPLNTDDITHEAATSSQIDDESAKSQK